MKPLHLLAIIFCTVFSQFCSAEQEATDVTPIKKIEVEGLNFADIPKDSQKGNLSEFVQDDCNLADAFLNRIRHYTPLYPLEEGMAYVNGQLCHVGKYPRSIIYTVLEGPYFGTQTTVTYDGIVLYVNQDYKIEYTPGGVIFRHEYADSKVITGANQVIKLY